MKSVQNALLCGVSALAFCAVSSVAAHAQSEGQIETVVVTGVSGSHVITDAAKSPTPLTIVTTEQLAATTPTNIPDGLNKLPIFQGSVQIRRSGDGSGGYGAAGTQGGNLATNVLNLRNFGSQRTLTLLDGHRAAPGNSDGTVDIDTLPQMLVSRVEIVTGGSGAVYGSDAITGVVNFILDKKFNGIRFDANSGISNYLDAAGFNAGMAFGTDLFGGRGHFEGSAEYRHQDGFLNTARPYGAGVEALVGSGTTANPFAYIPNGRRPNSTFGGLVQGCVPSCAAANQMQFVSNGVLGPFYAGLAGATDGNGNHIAGTSNENSGGDGVWSQFTTAQAAYRQGALFARFDYDVSPTTVFHLQGSAAESYTTGMHFNQKTTPGVGQADLFYKNNPFLTAATQTALGNNGTNALQTSATVQPQNTFQLGEFINDLGPQYVNRDSNTDQTISIQAGLDGSLMGDRFAWNLFYTHAENRLKVTLFNNQDFQHLYAAEDAVLNSSGQAVCYAATQAATAAAYANCVPIDLFGPNAVTQAAFNYESVNTDFIQSNKLDDFGGGISGTAFDDWAGPVRAALSAEMRFNNYAVTTNEVPNQLVDCTGLRLCNPTLGRYAQAVLVPVTASNNVWEVAGEAEVPLLADKPFVKDLELNLAGRYTDYSTSGPVETWKLGFTYQVNDQVRFRGTNSIDIRAPTLNDLNQPAVSVVQGFNDIHTGKNSTLQVITSGNPNLVPEVARTYTGGVVLTPHFIPGLTMSLDYFRIALSNAITTINPQTAAVQSVCEVSGGTSNLCSLMIRPLPFSDHTAANYPTAVYTEELNAASVRTEGWDFETNYAFDMADIVHDWSGTWTARGLASYQPFVKTVQFTGQNYSRLTNSHTRLTGFLNYTLDKWSFGLEDRWVSGFSLVGGVVTAAANNWVNPYVPSQNFVDLNVERDFVGGDIDMTGYFTIQNLFNSQPALIGSTTNIGLNYPVSPQGRDIMGRYFTIGVRIKE